jgi:Tol biopolymer transport system component
MSADGSDVRLTSSNLAGDPFSRWSPDGTRLLFLSGAYGEGALRLLDLRAKRERTIGSDTVRAYAWSPDGRSLVFALTAPGDFDDNELPAGVSASPRGR